VIAKSGLWIDGKIMDGRIILPGVVTDDYSPRIARKARRLQESSLGIDGKIMLRGERLMGF
jgi:hypothetical protein